jgi:predicted RNase H-like nuclease (RuvC/YqgF family)
MIGTFVNVGTIIVGSLIGGLFKKIMSDRVNDALFIAMGMAAFGLGINAVLKEEYEEEERRRRDEEYKRRQEKLETIRRRVLTSGESPEEYIAMLEKQIRTLESKCAELDAVRAELKETKQQLADEQMRNKQLELEIAQFVRAQPEPLAAKTIAARMGSAEITSSQKAASLLKNAAKMGWVVRLEVKGDVLWGAGEVCPA